MGVSVISSTSYSSDRFFLFLHPLFSSFPVALLAPNVSLERCEQLTSAPGRDRFSSDLFPWLLLGL